MLTACGEPLYAFIAVVDEDTPAHAVDASAPIDEEDASAAAVSNVSDCIELRDRSLPTQLSSLEEDASVLSFNANQQGCLSNDAGVPLLSDTLFRSRDGSLLVERGVTYSLRWPVLTFISRIRLHGGEARCPREPVVDAPAGPLSALMTCRELGSPIDSTQLRMYGSEDFHAVSQLDANAPIVFTLCRGSCPPNSQSFPDDAGVPGDGGADDTAP